MPVICVAALLVAGGFVTLIFGFIKSSDAYIGAVAQVKVAPAAIDALGSPIQEGFLVTGSVSANGASGKAELAIPVEGPKGKGTLYVEATKALGEWHYRYLILQIDQTHERIDVLKNKQPNQLPVPTKASVTPHAKPRVASDAVVAHI